MARGRSRAGVTLELLREHVVTNSPAPWLMGGVDGLYRLPPDRRPSP